MYIRWIVRKHKSVRALHTRFHDAYLVESFRDRKENPRQRTIAYLGNLREINDEFPAIERELFLLRVQHTLAGLSEVSKDDQERLLEILQQVAVPLAPAEIKHAFYQNLHWYVHACHHQEMALPTASEIYLLIEDLKVGL